MAVSKKWETATKAVMNLHNSDGLRWVGFPRADEQVKYCTFCNERAPCTTVNIINKALGLDK